MAPKLEGELSREGKERLVQAHARAASVPQYVRAAVEALTKAVERTPDGVDDALIAEPAEPAQRPASLAAPARRLR